MSTHSLHPSRTLAGITFSSGPPWNALGQLLSPLALALGTFTLYKILRFLWREYISNPLRDLPGPLSSGWLFGNMRQIWNAENAAMHEAWINEYGNTMKYTTLFGVPRLFTMDLKALNHVLMNSQTYEKPEQSRAFLSGILGNGVIIAEGSKHREQRKVMNPAFGSLQIRELTEIFVEKSLELRDVWAADAKKQIQGEKTQARINVMNGLSKMTLDVIGLAGFNYKFGSLSGEKSELNEAFSALFSSGSGRPIFIILRHMLGRFGALVPLPGGSNKARIEARATMDRIGIQLLNESRAALEDFDGKKDEEFKRRDLLSLLLKANMSTEIPENQRMSDQDVLAQVPTFLVAGHETTSNTTTWALYALSLFPEIQNKLRNEIFTIQSDNPTMDELNSLPYLDAVIRETLRLYPPVAGTIRVAVKDDIVPLGTPFADKKGEMKDTIPMRKGQTVFVSISAVNRSKQLWGPDAREFRPERWESPSEAVSGIPGVWGNMLTFLGGPRACIGYRFSLVEMKALLFTLIRAFEFELAIPTSDIGKRGMFMQRPFLINDPKAENQMPLLVKPHLPAD